VTCHFLVDVVHDESGPEPLIESRSDRGSRLPRHQCADSISFQRSARHEQHRRANLHRHALRLGDGQLRACHITIRPIPTTTIRLAGIFQSSDPVRVRNKMGGRRIDIIIRMLIPLGSLTRPSRDARKLPGEGALAEARPSSLHWTAIPRKPAGFGAEKQILAVQSASRGRRRCHQT